MKADAIGVLAFAVDAFNRHDVDMLVELADPDVEFGSSLATLEGEYRGHDGIRRYMADVAAAFGDEWGAEAERVAAVDESRAILIVRVFGQGTVSGLPVEHRFAHVWELRDGKLWRGRVYLDPAEALRAVGVEP